MTDRLNIVLIMVDQWRGDCLSIDDHPVVQTPALDELALGGARFSRAYTATPSCIPARAALFTGQRQETHGRVGYQDGIPWNYPVTLAGEFTRHGYQTQAVGKMHVYPERSQMGFQHVVLHDGYVHFSRGHTANPALIDDYLPWLQEKAGYGADYFEHGVNCNSVVARPWDKPESLHPTNYVTSQSIDFLRRRDPCTPFFLFMSYHRPHPPYDPPAWAFEQYLHQPMPEVPVGDWTGITAPYANPRNHCAAAGEMDPRVVHRARAGYYGHITHIDSQIHRFVEALRDYGLQQNTLICFTSDHGELLGDHHLFRKTLPYEGSARIPLILHGPGSGIPRNAVRDEVAELRDIMPTLLDAAGLPVPETVEGQSLLPPVRKEGVNWRSYLHGEHVVFGNQSCQWLTDGKDKYIWWSGDGHEQLFDLQADPQELHDLACDPGKADRLAHWRKLLIRELAGREEGFTDGRQLITGRPVHPCLSFLREGD